MATTTAQPVAAFDELNLKIQQRAARVAIIGLGYVGCPLAVEFAKSGYAVTAIDLLQWKVDTVNTGQSHIPDVSAEDIRNLVDRQMLRATTDFSVLTDVDAVSICVPTPLRKTKDPDLTYVVAACEEVARYAHPGILVVLESTTYPGTTKEVLLPLLERSGLKVGRDIFLCFSPERVDPGNARYQTANIPKVIGGVTPECTRLGIQLYSQAMEKIVPVSSTEVAEMVKLLENTFRMINIGLANEMALMCDRMGINVWEVIDAAATKPFGFMPFYPGPGLGGHCIPIDPFYLSWKTRQVGIEARFIELAGYINGQMPRFVVNKIQSALNDQGKAVRDCQIHLLGVAYKRDIDDVRESPALDIIHLLSSLGARVTFSDPLIDSVRLEDGKILLSEPLLAACSRADCVVVVTDHSTFDYASVVAESKVIVDSRNALRDYKSSKIIRL